MEKNTTPHILVRNSGVAYVALLFLTVILSTLSLAFIQKTGTGTAATATRGSGMQAHYLAESAANHALWRLLNELDFPAETDRYYMHSLAGGRYGYKVKAPTATTFAAVATVGAVSDYVVHHSYILYVLPQPQGLMAAYCDTSGNSHPYRRIEGGAFGSANPTFDIGSNTVQWVELAGHPFVNEIVAGFTDQDPDVELGVWDGSSWGNAWTFIDTAEAQYHCFDIAYTASGRALALGYDTTSAGNVMYTVWNGTSWSDRDVAFGIGSGDEVRFLVAEGNPTANEILIAVLDDRWELSLYRWDGTNFASLGLLTDSPASRDTWVAGIAYEQQSGDALIVWGRDRDNCEYAVWDGTVLDPIGELLPSFGDDSYNIRTAADPTSDTIFLMANTRASDIYAAVWNGTSWTDSRRLESDAEQGRDDDYLNFAAAWENSGSEVIAAWGRNHESEVRYIRWSKGTALSSATVEVGPDFDDDIRAMRMCPVPGGDRIAVACNNQSRGLRYCLWTGDGFSGGPPLLLTENQPTAEHLSFDLAISDYQDPPENQAPVVDAGDDLIAAPSAQVNLDGTVSDDGLPLPPGPLNTLWSKEGGPGDVTFGDAAQVDTTASFSEEGVYVLRLTANDSLLEDFDEVTITVEQAEYVETDETFFAAEYDQWHALDLSGDPFNVPPDVVLEVALRNRKRNAQRWGGVRAVGSDLDRRLELHEADGGGVDVVVMHVQVDSNSQIQCYADTSDIRFQMVGYWRGGSYVEQFDSFAASRSDEWEDRELLSFGVSPGQVAELVIVNTDDRNERTGGVRTDGSGLHRELDIHEADGGGVDTCTMLVKAGGDANATIELWADDRNDIGFYLIGYWSSPPGAFTESYVDLGGPSADETWEVQDLSSSGVPNGAVVQIAMVNEDNNGVYRMGLREMDSTLTRRVNLHEAKDGGGDIGSIHVKADETAAIRWYHSNVSHDHSFYLLGFWELF